MQRAYDILVITGPTATGKTALAAELAYITGGEVVSADSRQVYRGMDIGSGKDYSDFRVSGVTIPCHLIDIVEPGYKYNVFEYQRDFSQVYKDLRERNVLPVVCGGSGMYIDCIIRGYELAEVPPDTGLRARLEKKPMDELVEILATYKRLHNKTDIDTKKRVIRAIEIEHHSTIIRRKTDHFPLIRPLIAGLHVDRETRRRRITERLASRLAGGLVEEVEALLEKGVSSETLIYYGLEYKYVTLYLKKKLRYDEMVKSLEIAIHQFAKRQMTWFRGMERKGITIHWIDGLLPMNEKVKLVLGLFSGT